VCGDRSEKATDWIDLCPGFDLAHHAVNIATDARVVEE